MAAVVTAVTDVTDVTAVGEEPLEIGLPQIDSPEAAIAEASQRQTTATMVLPRGVVSRLMPGAPITIPVPHEQSSNWFKEIYNGWMAAQFVSFAQFATDPLKMLHSESVELSTTVECLDDSLPQRKVATWLLGDYGEHASKTIDALLDSFARWSNFEVDGSMKIVNQIRMSALFGIDAKRILEAVKHEMVETPSFKGPGDCLILVRWHNGTAMQSVAYEFNNPTNPLECIQDAFVRLSGIHDIPIPSSCMKPMAGGALKSNEFYHILHGASCAFFSTLTGTPSLTFSNETRQKNASRILQPMGCIVRICNKMLGPDGRSDPSCFHGAIVGFANKRHDAQAFLEQVDSDGIRPPISKDEHALGLHLCAVQAERMSLGRQISLFGTSGVAGKPIHLPGSWIWVARPAVRPIQSDLLNVFALHPCSRMSLLPGRSELVPAFERFWKHTTQIYKMIANGESRYEHPSMTPLKMAPPCHPPDVPVSELKLSSDEVACLTMMQIDLKSERTTLGDAYARIAMLPGAESVSKNMKQAMASIGICASLADMFNYNHQAIATVRTLSNTKRKSEDPLALLCDVAIDMATDAKRLKKQDAYGFNSKGTPMCLSADRVRRILRACSLRGCDHVSVEGGFTTQCGYETILTDIITTSVWVGSSNSSNDDGRVSALIRRPLKQLFVTKLSEEWLVSVERAIAMASAVAMVAGGSINGLLFLVVGRSDGEEVRVKSVSLNGALSISSFDEMCKVFAPRVIILQQLTKNRVRITGTMRTGAVE